MGGISANHHVIWVFPEDLSKMMSSATWLDTTSELRKLGWRVTLIIAGPPTLKDIRGVEVLTIPNPNLYLFGQLFFHMSSFHFILRHWKSIDVILFHQISAAWFLPIRLIRRFIGGCLPLLVMDTRSVPMTADTFRDNVLSRYYYFMNYLANRFADGQTAITPQIAHSLKIPSEKLWGTWPSGVDNEKVSQAINIRHWPSSTSQVQLIYTGVLSNERNLFQLYKAVELANSEGKSFILTLIGDGPARSNLENIADSSRGRLIVLPPIPHNSMPIFLAGAHVGTLPFPDEEKFRVSSPVKLFEYMAAGLPILATRIKCHTDVISDRNYAFWADGSSIDELYYALIKIWNSRDSLHILGQQAAIDSKAWSWNKSAIKLSTALLNGIEMSLNNKVWI